MIKINFIPQETRKKRGNPWQDGFGPIPREEVIGFLVAAAAILVSFHIFWAVMALVKVAQHTMLEVRWGALGPEKKALDEVTNETKLLQTKMNALRIITAEQGGNWARLLNEVSDSVPKGVWIREMKFEKGVLTINGSAVSKDKSEMIIVNNFVAAIKDQSAMKKGFVSIDVDSILQRENSLLSIADFSMKARRAEKKKEVKKDAKKGASKAAK